LSLIALLKGAGLKLVERPFTVAEAKAAREAFLTSTTNFVLSVVRIDDTPIGNGHPGSVVQRLREAYAAHTAAQGPR
jgi:D-alanine transaminase